MSKPVLGTFLTLVSWLGFTVLSQQFTYGYGHAQRPIPLIIACLFGAFLGLLLLWPLAKRNDRKTLVFILGLGLALRFLLNFSNPVQEDDFYRYLWDGQVILSGQNPYELAPSQRSLEDVQIAQGDQRFAEAYLVKSRINYPQVSTIYPPLAQFSFACAQWLSPWSLWGLRLLWLLADALVLCVLCSLLKNLKLPLGMSYLYYLNPLLLKEVFNSLHFDILCALCLIVWLWAYQRKSYALGSLALLGSGLVKIVPLALVPLSLAFLYRKGQFRQMLALCLMVVLSLVLLFVPGAYAHGIFVGLKEFATHWQINASIFALLSLVFSSSLSKMILAMIQLGVLAALTLKLKSFQNLVGYSFAFLLLTFLCSPCGNPWYLVWSLPFFALLPYPWVWGLYTAVSLYYGIFYLEYQQLLPWVPALQVVEWAFPIIIYFRNYFYFLWPSVQERRFCL